MAESTLSLRKSDLEIEVADFAGFDTDSANWTERQTSQINRTVKSALRMVYFTQEVLSKDGKILVEGGYSWAFLMPVKQITLLSGANTVDMPDDFGGILGRVIPASLSGVASVFPIPLVGEHQLYSMETLTPSATGRPAFALVEAIKGTSNTEGSRSRLRFYPTADQDYDLKIWHTILPDAITDAFPFVYGGAQHAETFKCAARAAYEQDFDGEPGAETMRFIERLKASIAIDRKMKPIELGRNRDLSDQMPAWYSGHGVGSSFDVNGVTPAVWTAY